MRKYDPEEILKNARQNKGVNSAEYQRELKLFIQQVCLEGYRTEVSNPRLGVVEVTEYNLPLANKIADDFIKEANKGGGVNNSIPVIIKFECLEDESVADTDSP